MTDPAPYCKTTGIIRILRACRYSWQGLRAAWRAEAAFRQEILACAVLIPVAFWVEVSRAERAALIASLFVVLVAELGNSALEALTDRVSTDHHPLSGRAKDIGSAMVAVALLNAVFVWGVVLW